MSEDSDDQLRSPSWEATAREHVAQSLEASAREYQSRVGDVADDLRDDKTMTTEDIWYLWQAAVDQQETVLSSLYPITTDLRTDIDTDGLDEVIELQHLLLQLLEQKYTATTTIDVRLAADVLERLGNLEETLRTDVDTRKETADEPDHPFFDIDLSEFEPMSEEEFYDRFEDDSDDS